MENVTLATAQKLVELGCKKATQDFSRPICIAVCDADGHAIAFGRMDGSPLRSINISQQKAYTSVRMGVSTDAFLARLKRDEIEIGYFCDPLFTALPGGNPLKNKEGKLIGGVGISGLAASEDQVITEYLAGLVSAGQI
ncbi:MAG: heme-binding protein [Negativicutes bacterium]|nr:heme-binding protein [Negativicutes bacterium]